MSGHDFAEALRAGLHSYGPRPCIEFERTWYSGDHITGYIAGIDDALQSGGVRPDEPVGLIVRNRVPHAAAVLGFIAARRPVSMIYSYQSAQAIARDITALRPAAILADPQDWDAEAMAAVGSVGAAAVVLNPTAATLAQTARPGAVLDPTVCHDGLQILTSGTTGPPKRMPIPTAVLAHTVLSMTLGRTVTPDDAPALVFWPFGSVGVCQLLAGAYCGQRIVLLEKFTVDEWVRAVREYRVQWTGVQPTVVRMLLQADIDKADLASLEYLPGGGGPLEPELQQAFEQRYGIPLLWGYGATEFAGTVCSWTPALREEFGDTKPGTVGRALPGVQVRILDPSSGEPAPTGQQGILSARVEALGPQWISTTDIAAVDEDGFVTVYGRADGAINRGGFKVLPERVRKALLTHPGVRDACVVAVPDARLGEVPFAAVEIARGAAVPTEAELKNVVRESLPAQAVPVQVAVLDELPRNAAMKVRIDAIAALFGG